MKYQDLIKTILHQFKLAYDTEREGYTIPTNRIPTPTPPAQRVQRPRDKRIGTDYKGDKYYIEETDKSRNEIFSYDYLKAKTEKNKFFWVEAALNDNDLQAIEEYNNDRKSNRIKSDVYEKIKPFFTKGWTAEQISKEIGASASTVQRYTKRIKDANPPPTGFSFEKTD